MQFIGIDTYCDGGNGTIDWSAAKAGGITYASIRASYGTGYIRNKANQDKKFFDANWAPMKKAGIVRNAYLFLRYPYKGVAAPEPEAQAKAICDVVGPLEQSDLPITIDFEFPGAGAVDTWTDSKTKKPMTKAQLMAWFLRAWQYIKDKYGVAPPIYSSARVWLDDLGNPDVPAAVKESLLWLAKYTYNPGPAVMNPAGVLDPPVPPPWAGTDPKDITYRGMPYSDDNWFIHQYMGDSTGAPGMPKGNEDMNRMRSLQKEAKPVARERVKWVQKRLGFTGATNVDGKFGTMTDTAVRKLQTSKSDLVVDGIIGPRTFAYLCWMNP